MDEICGVKIEEVVKAIREQVEQNLGAWRENMKHEEFAQNPVAYIGEKSPWLEAPFELARYAKHFAKDEADKARARARAEALFKAVLAGEAALALGHAGKETIRNKAKRVLDNNLTDTMSFCELVTQLGKREKANLMNI